MIESTQLSTLRTEATGMIQDFAQAEKRRENLLRAAVDCVVKLGYSVDSVSAETGFRPDEIRAAMGNPATLMNDELAELAGIS